MPVASSAAKATTGQASIGGTSALLVASNPRRCSLIVRNTHATQTLLLGTSSGVTTSTGHAVPAGQREVLVDYRGPVHAIASGASTTCSFWESGVG